MCRLFASSLFVAAFLPLATGQLPGPRHVTRPAAERELRLDPRSYHQDRLVVKFREGARVRLAATARPGAMLGSDLRSLDTLDLSRVSRLVGKHRVERVFSRTPEDLDRERATLVVRAAAMPGVAPPADLNNYYRVFTSGQAETRKLLEAFLADPAVETAYPEFHPRATVPAQVGIKKLPDGPAPGQTPLFEDKQGYLDAAPRGIGYRPAIGINGVLGSREQTIVHIEGSWYFDHEDIPQLTESAVLGSKKFFWFDTDEWRNHGTAIVGLLTASRDRKGIRGMIPHSRLHVVSLINKHGNAISLATAKAGPGDVFTSSAVESIFYRSRGYHAPLDIVQDAYDAIRIAVLKGIVVTVASGNTSADLATKEIYGTRYLTQSTPSGAIHVGATFGPELKKVSWSNHGNVIRANGWGAQVYTTGYGHQFRSVDAGRTRDYTFTFGGTSAAAPQVAGVAAAIQMTSKIHLGKPLEPEVVARVIERTGTPIGGNIGVRPNLIEALRMVGVIDGLRVLSEPAPGETLTLGLELRPNEIYILLGAIVERRIPWPGLTFPFLIDPTAMVIIASGTMPSQTATHPVPLAMPNWRFLQGLHFYYQGVRVDLKGRSVDTTNGVDAWMRSWRLFQ